MLYEKYGKVRSDERSTLLFDFPENGGGGMRMSESKEMTCRYSMSDLNEWL